MLLKQAGNNIMVLFFNSFINIENNPGPIPGPQAGQLSGVNIYDHKHTPGPPDSTQAGQRAGPGTN